MNICDILLFILRGNFCVNLSDLSSILLLNSDFLLCLYSSNSFPCWAGFLRVSLRFQGSNIYIYRIFDVPLNFLRSKISSCPFRRMKILLKFWITNMFPLSKLQHKNLRCNKLFRGQRLSSRWGIEPKLNINRAQSIVRRLCG